MNPKRYLELCQRVAILPNGVLGIKQNVPDELKVIYNGVIYYPHERLVSFDAKGKMIIKARLHELDSNCVVECKIEKVEEFVK